MISKLSFLFVFSVISCFGDQFLYKGYKIYEVEPKSEYQLKVLGEFYEQHEEFDFLNDIFMINGSTRVVTSPSDIPKLEAFLRNKSLSFSIVNEDLSETISSEYPQPENNKRIFRASQKLISFSKYHRHKDINAYLDKLNKVYPTLVTVESIGDSLEGRKMKIIRISNGLHDRLNPKKIIFIEAGIHAREWIAPATALYVIHQLVENQKANKDLLLGYDWIILPVANPDGYEYSFSNKRLWRKTRSKNNDKKCPGADANRNFGYNWGLGKDFKNECSDVYPGSRAFSEVETQHLRDLLLKIKDSCKLYLSLHSFGRFIFYPWSWDTNNVDNLNHQHQVAMAGKNVASEEHHANYLVGSPARIYKRISGATIDWAHAIANIPVTITIELPAGGEGFDPPTKDIKKMVGEGWDIIKAMAKKTKEIFR